jgi:hypothetical protein
MAYAGPEAGWGQDWQAPAQWCQGGPEPFQAQAAQPDVYADADAYGQPTRFLEGASGNLQMESPSGSWNPSDSGSMPPTPMQGQQAADGYSCDFYTPSQPYSPASSQPSYSPGGMGYLCSLSGQSFGYAQPQHDRSPHAQPVGRQDDYARTRYLPDPTCWPACAPHQNPAVPVGYHGTSAVPAAGPLPEWSQKTGPDAEPQPASDAKQEDASETTTRAGDASTDACSNPSERQPVAPDLQAALAELNEPQALRETLYRLRAHERPQELALALYARVDDQCAKAVAEILAEDRTIVQKVLQLLREDLPAIAGDAPPDNSYGAILLASDLFVRGLLGMSGVKEIFAALLFAQTHPPDHAVNLACHVFITVGPVLDQTDVGAKMVAYLTLRLKEVKGGNLTAQTREAITRSVDLRNHKWVLVPRRTVVKKTAGQKKARAAARVRVKDLLQQVAEGCEPLSLWPEDTETVAALLELAASRDPSRDQAFSLVEQYLAGGKYNELKDQLEAAGPGDDYRYRNMLTALF